MNREQKELYEKFMNTALPKHDLTKEEMFHAGCMALRQELERFINEKLDGERGDLFSMGQDDGLRWIKDHLAFIFDASY